jgi:lysophospholipase
MPSVPEPSEFISQKLNQRATIFGCNDPSKVTLVWLPNQKWSYDSNVATSQFEYTTDETAAMIQNGNSIATQGGDKQWTVCLACVIVHKTATFLPDDCKACLEKYCYSG